MPSTVQRELSAGKAAAAAWSDSTTVSAAVSLGYLERLRLGLGSPYRLIEYAQLDPRLDAATRARLGWALLARLRIGAAYQIDPAALNSVGPGWSRNSGFGREHLRIALAGVLHATDPRAGELGVRIGYLMAEREGLVRPGTAKLMAGATALLVDRELARADATKLLRRSIRPLEQVAVWRAERRFEVEQPRMGPVSAALELQATSVARSTMQQLRTLALRAGSGEQLADNAPPAPAIPNKLLPQLETQHHELHYPPQTPVTLVARQVMRDVQPMGWATPEQRARRHEFASRVNNEESFVIEHTRARLAGLDDSAYALAALNAAVALRSYAQERVWLPGMPGPTVRELEELYGLASITFEAGVPGSWRPYYRWMLSSSLEDLHRVMPATSLRGLKVRFGAVAGSHDVLAMHDPRQRRLLLPLSTSAGTLAHELAHDIDWQQAVAKYRVHGDYATDRAWRRQSDAFGRRVDALRTASINGGGANSAHAVRPAEVFARNVDWYVSVSLAKQGRRNGYLSSVQDELLTGYGTVRSPDVSGEAGDALMEVMNDLAPIYREQRDAFRAVYGSNRTLRSFDLVRGLAEKPLPSDLAAALREIAAQREVAQRSLNIAPCAAPLGNSQLRSARESMIDLASESRARGAALRHMQRKHGRAGRLAMMEKFYGGPLPVDSSMAAHADELLVQVKSLSASRAPQSARPFQLAGAGCLAIASL